MPTPARGAGRSRPRTSPGPGRGRSAARRTPPRQPAAQSAGGDDRPRTRFTARSALLCVVLAVLMVSYASSMKAWLQQREHIADLERQIAADQAAVDRLREEKERWRDPAYVRAQARERFGMVLPGETGFRVIGEDGEPLGVPTELSEPTSVVPPTPWWELAWGSIEEAGTEPESTADDEPARYLGPPGARR